MRSLSKLNRGKKYRNRIKPFDFLLSCHVKPFGYPPDVDPEKFHLVAPYVPDPECWMDLPWIDQYSGRHYEITTEGFHGTRGVARVKTLRRGFAPVRIPSRREERGCERKA